MAEVTGGGSSPRSSSKEPKALPRDAAERRARLLKRGLFVLSVISFGVLLQAAAHHLTGVTSRSTQSVTGGPGSPTSPSQGNGYGSPSQGYGYGSSSQGYDFGSAPQSPPVTFSGVS